MVRLWGSVLANRYRTVFFDVKVCQDDEPINLQQLSPDASRALRAMNVVVFISFRRGSRI